jgi:hypothetical protein
MRCEATTAKGKPCRAHAMPGSTLCSSHLGRGGRPTLMTDELVDQLLSMLRAGSYVGTAARAAGIGRQTLADWLKRGEHAPEGDPYRELRDQIDQARAEGEARNVARVQAAAVESWQAAAWLLERQYPERWGKPSTRIRVPLEPAAAETTTIEEELLDDDPFAEVDELAAARRRKAGLD